MAYRGGELVESAACLRLAFGAAICMVVGDEALAAGRVVGELVDQRELVQLRSTSPGSDPVVWVGKYHGGVGEGVHCAEMPSASPGEAKGGGRISPDVWKTRA